MAMYLTARLNGSEVIENIQGGLCDMACDYVEIMGGEEATYKTYEMNAAGFAKYIASQNTAYIENGVAVFKESDPLAYQEHVCLRPDMSDQRQLAENFNKAKTLFGIQIDKNSKLTFEFN